MSRFVRLYPATWRARYEAELNDALASRPLTVRDRWDLVRGALDAWVHPELVEPVAGELALAGHGSFEAHHRAEIERQCKLGQYPGVDQFGPSTGQHTLG